MPDNLDLEIEDSLFNEKLKSIFKKNKFKIILIFFLIISIPLFYQFYFFFKTKEQEKLLLQYLNVEIVEKKDEYKAIEILNTLKEENNDTIKILAQSKLMEYYIRKNKKDKLQELLEKKIDYKNPLYNEIFNIKKIIIKFDNIDEKNIIELSKEKKLSFKKVNKKIMYDFYIKSRQYNKAKQILN